jgi:hypothetical protein
MKRVGNSSVRRMGAEAKDPAAFQVGEMRTSPEGDRLLARAFFVTGFLLVALDEVVLYQP